MYSINENLFFYLHDLAQSAPELWLFLAGWFGVAIALAAILFVGFHKHGFKSVFKGFKHHLREWGALIFLPIATWAVTDFLKMIFLKARPYESMIIEPLSMPGSMDSFPSGHAAFYMAVALAVYRYHKKAGIFFIVLAALLSVARIITGVHFPVDIIGGWLVAYLLYRLTK